MPELWYDRPAAGWTDALPLGNGRLGAMVFGGTSRDRLQVNDDTCWSGSPRVSGSRATRFVAGHGPATVDAARRALARGDVREAEFHVKRLQGGYVESYQPLVDLWLADLEPLEAPSEYRRWLRLDEAVAGHSWVVGGTRFEQEAFVSRPAGVLVVHRTSTSPLDLTVTVTSQHRLDAVTASGVSASWVGSVRMPASVLPDYVAAQGSAATPSASPGDSVTCVIGVRVLTDGVTSAGPDGAQVQGATWVTVLLTSESDYAGPSTPLHGDGARLRQTALARLDAAARVGLPALRAQHVADHAALFDRVSLSLGADGDRPELPTDERLVRHQHGHSDPDLAALAFQYGRYLMIAGSRPGTLPLNLQGIWNDSTRPPWSSNYTININTQMSYWPALSANLSECHEPLLAWVEELAFAGRRTASELYGVRGWTAHHNSDCWAFTEPVGRGEDNPSWSFWPFGGVWQTRHLVDHYEFTGDDEFLARVRPVIVGAAAFVLDWLVDLPDGSLGTCPATSPENSFVAADGRPAALSTSTTADLAMARDLLENVRRLTQHDHGLISRIDAALDRMPTERVRSDGRLAEWRDEVPEAEPEHRHQTHLFRVHPGTSIDPDQSPDLAAAALATLDARGRESTGWSLAWRLNLRARLRDRAGAQVMVDAFLRPVGLDAAMSVRGGGVYRNMCCAHPPFQIDGNLGFTAGIVELLVQGHRVHQGGLREVHLLPCLPPAWPSGSARGLRVRGGITVDLEWSDGTLTAATFTAHRDTAVLARYGNATSRVDLPAGIPVPPLP